MYQFTGGTWGHHHSPPLNHATHNNHPGQQQSFHTSSAYGQYPNQQQQQSPWSVSVAAATSSTPQNTGHPSSQQPLPHQQIYPPNQQYRPQYLSNNSQYHPPPQYGNYPSNPQAPYGGYSIPPSGQVPPQPTSYTSSQITHPPQHSTGPHQQQAIPPALAISTRSNENCYNCGAPGHFAQTCPEPRRAIPAGQVSRGRPFKRQKTYGGATMSHSSGPSQPFPSPQRGWTHPPPNQSSFPSTQSPPILNSANTNSQHALSQHQVPQNSSNLEERYPWSQQQAHQTPTASSGLHPWNHQQSPKTPFKPSLQNPGNEQEQPQSSISSNVQRPWRQQQSPHSFPAVPDTSSINLPSPWNQQQHRNIRHSQIPGQQSPNQAFPTPAPSSNDSQIPSPATSILNNYQDQVAQQTPSSCADPAFPRNDSITSLDERLQAKPQAIGLKSEETVNRIAEAHVKLVPASSLQPEKNSENISTAEPWLQELQALDYPDEASPTDISVSDLSKFIHELDDPDYLSNVQDRPQWTEMRDDPIFAKIKANTPTVTFDELILRRNELIAPAEISTEEFQTIEDADEEEYDQTHLSKAQEERLAALGVSGFAKPVRASNRRTFSAAAPEELFSQPSSRSPASRDRSGSNSDLYRTPSPADPQAVRSLASATDAKNSNFDRDSQEISPQVNGHPTYPPYGAPSIVNDSSDSFEHPPPQKPHFERSRSIKSSPIEGTNNFTTNGDSKYTTGPKWRMKRSHGSASPSDSPRISRKRSYRESSEDSDGKPRRQEEEAIDRRKHPKVAAAYDRRW